MTTDKKRRLNSAYQDTLDHNELEERALETGPIVLPRFASGHPYFYGSSQDSALLNPRLRPLDGFIRLFPCNGRYPNIASEGSRKSRDILISQKIR